MMISKHSVHIAAAFFAVCLYVLVPPVVAQECPELVRGVPGNAGCGIVVSGGYAYVVRCPDSGPTGLDVYDLSDPTDPVHVGELAEPSWSFDSNRHAMSGNYLYVAAGSLGLRVVDVSDPTAPVEVGGHPGGGDVSAVAVSGTLAYVADSDSGLLVLDVSDPLLPVQIGFVPLSGALAVAVAGDNAYVAAVGEGLVVINVSNPSAPSILTVVPLYPLIATDVALDGMYAYVTRGTLSFGRLSIFNVSVPGLPAEVGSVGTLGLTEVESSQHFAYVREVVVEGGGSTLVVVDVHSPQSPSIVSSTPLWFTSLAISNGYIYIPDPSYPPYGDGGLEVFRDCASVFLDGFESGDTTSWTYSVP